MKDNFRAVIETRSSCQEKILFFSGTVTSCYHILLLSSYLLYYFRLFAKMNLSLRFALSTSKVANAGQSSHQSFSFPTGPAELGEAVIQCKGRLNRIREQVTGIIEFYLLFVLSVL